MAALTGRGSGQHVQFLVRSAYQPAGFGELFGVVGGLDQAFENAEPRGEHFLVQQGLRVPEADKGPVEPVVHERVGHPLQMLEMAFALEQLENAFGLLLGGR